MLSEEEMEELEVRYVRVGQDDNYIRADDLTRIVKDVEAALRAQTDAKPIYQTMCTDEDEVEHDQSSRNLWMDVPERVFKHLKKRQDMRFRIVYTHPAPEAAQTGLPAEVIAWHAARQAHIDACAAYNARIEAIRASEEKNPKTFGEMKSDVEWNLMEESKRKMFALLEPMFNALTPILTRASAATIPESWRELMRFYQVETPEALVAAMERHIGKLQEKRSAEPAFTRVREG